MNINVYLYTINAAAGKLHCVGWGE